MTTAAAGKAVVDICQKRGEQQTGNLITGTKRGRYVSRACLSCQHRKVKCSGQDPCQQCHYNNFQCKYASGRIRRPRAGKAMIQDGANAAQLQARSLPLIPGLESYTSPTSTKQQSEGTDAWKLDVIARLASLEQKLDNMQPNTATFSLPSVQHSSDSILPQRSRVCWETFTDQYNCISEEFGHLDYEQSAFHSGTDLLTPISILDCNFARDAERARVQTSVTLETTSPCVNYGVCCPCCLKNILSFSNESPSTLEAEAIRAHVRAYLSCINTHYPCLNEESFLADLEDYLAEDKPKLRPVTSTRFKALVHLIVAVNKILSEDCTVLTGILGWQEFVQAEQLLHYSIWSGRGDLLVLQCLMIKTLFLIFSERTSMASISISSAVRLGYQVGLYDQTSWKTDDSNEVAMRQRVFWCLYCLDRHVALVCGVPYLIRESDFRVNEPLVVQDTGFSPSASASGEIPYCSSILYLRSTIKWARLSAEIWDGIFGIKAANPADREFVAAIDARVTLLIQDLPSQFQWSSQTMPSSDTDGLPRHVYRQCMIINLRINHLRLLLRRREMVSLKYSNRTAEICTEIATRSINAIHAFYTSHMSQSTDRYSSVNFLASAIVPLICIIIKETKSSTARMVAEETFRKALAILKDISRSLRFAKRMLQRLGRLVDADKEATVVLSPTDTSHEGRFGSTFESALLDTDWLLCEEILGSDFCQDSHQGSCHESLLMGDFELLSENMS